MATHQAGSGGLKRSKVLSEEVLSQHAASQQPKHTSSHPPSKAVFNSPKATANVVNSPAVVNSFNPQGAWEPIVPSSMTLVNADASGQAAALVQLY